MISFRVKRVCRASLQGEAYGLVEGAESVDWLRALLADADHRAPYVALQAPRLMA